MQRVWDLHRVESFPQALSGSCFMGLGPRTDKLVLGMPGLGLSFQHYLRAVS